MKKVFLGIFILVFLLSASLLSGCSQSISDSNTNVKSDELIVAIGGEPESGFDPTTGWGRYGTPLFQSTLLTRDSALNITKDLAEHYEISEDGLIWTIALQKDATFSDGKPLTAEDVQYTFETASKSGSVIDLSILKEIKIMDDHKIQFVLKYPQSTFVNTLITLGIVPKHAHNQEYAENPIGSGPYQFVQWDKGQQLIVEANPRYYGKKPHFQKITFLFLNEDAAFAAAKAGKVDMAYIPPAFSKQQIPNMRLLNIKSVDNRGIMFPTVQWGQTTEEGVFIGNAVTADLAIRQGINIAISRKSLVNGILEGFGSPAYTVCDHLPWWNPDTVFEDGNLEKAKEILSNGGWRDQDEDGILEKGSLKAEFTLIYPSSDQTRQSLAIATADMVKSLGIHIVTEGKSWNDIKKMMHSNAVLFGWGDHNPLEMYNLYSSKNKGIGWYNTGYYSNAVVDGYMEKALASTDEAEALAYWKKAQWDGQTGFSAKGDAPWAWLVNLDHLYLVNEKLDLGSLKVQPHGHGWPITDNIVDWKWKN